MALKVIIYIVSALYGFSITYFGMQWLRKMSFRSIRQGRYNPIGSYIYMLIGGVFLFFPVLYDIWAFLISFMVSMVTNIIVLLGLVKINKTKNSHPQKENH